MGLYQRTLNLPALLAKKSFFLFGPRGTGKTTLVKRQCRGARIIDLLDAPVFSDLLRNPQLIGEYASGLIVIDEIQKLPSLLDEVHRLMESKRNNKFLLTGSSARKLKRGSANLLAGRAWWAELFPLTFNEIDDFDLLTYLNTGGLPAIYGSSNATEELRAYSALYLKEEVQQEALTRKIASFAEFLELIALCVGEELNYQSLSSDLGVAVNSIKNFIEVLEDTLIGFSLAAYTKTKKRKAITRSKFYLFDVGVANYLAKRGQIFAGSELFGKAFEHFIIQEVRAYLSYARRDLAISYWRSTSKFEVDLIVGNEYALEIKATKLVQDKHLKGLRAFKEEQLIKQFAAISLDRDERVTHDAIKILPWKTFLRRMWVGELF